MERIFYHNNGGLKLVVLKNCLLDEELKDIMIINDKIVKIGEIRVECLEHIFKVLTIIDVEGKRVIPGYIDNHVHIIGGGGESGFSSRVPEINFSSVVSNGITTLVGVLGTDSVTRSIENLVAKTKALNEEGITAYCLTGAYEYPSPTITGKIQNDIVFVKEIIGTKIAISDHRCYNPSKEDLIKLLSETRIAGLISKKKTTVNFHVGWGKGNMDTIIDVLEKTNIPRELVRPTHISNNERNFKQALRLAKAGSYIDITAGKDIEKTIKYILKVIKNGYIDKLTMSSDANGSVPNWRDGKCVGITAHTMDGMHKVIKKLILEYNVSLKDAIKILTINPANALGLDNKGIIEENKDADIIILDDEYNIDTVIALGKIVFQNKEIKVKGRYER